MHHPRPSLAAQTLPTFEAGRPRRARSNKLDGAASNEVLAVGGAGNIDSSDLAASEDGGEIHAVDVADSTNKDAENHGANPSDAVVVAAPGTDLEEEATMTGNSDVSQDLFEEFARMVFRNADADGNGLLDEQECVHACMHS